jgi:hypothetical protein
MNRLTERLRARREDTNAKSEEEANTDLEEEAHTEFREVVKPSQTVLDAGPDDQTHGEADNHSNEDPKPEEDALAWQTGRRDLYG